ncbi:MAG: threonine--tRNA ligase [Candidatus Nanoarchaeia archaeon]|nr:threonine--tRNA ligase [Candidatus Nanoarchaeia archaeon]
MDLETLRHSTSHVMAAAVKKLYPDVKLGIGPAIEEGFYYDFGNLNIKEEDLKNIEKEMHRIIEKDEKFIQKSVSRKEAEKLLKNEPYKLDLLKDLEDDKISFYYTGEFFDLCKGPHIHSTKEIKAFKLTKLAGAYWRGDSDNDMLQRIYGIAFSSEKELKEYLKLLEEAEKRNHVKLGKQLDLFSIHPEAPGMPFFHDKGTFIFNKLAEFMRKEMKKRGYEENKTPIILNKYLWERSGHWDHYKDNMYFTKIDKQDFAVKPMNCPGNLLVYKTKVRSYRDLPLKAGEFGLVHRHELSGVLNGLFRVRAFTQDDAHVFCEEEQLKDSIIELIELCDFIYHSFKLEYEVELSTKPGKAMGSQEIWDKAEDSLKDALATKKLKYEISEGAGAFYGPKIDFHVKDALGRKWQCGTIQVDFSMPEKFDLTYEGKDGTKHRPVMVHRAIYGSFERFIGILIEHYSGNFPLWISPIQVIVLNLTDKNIKFCDIIVSKLKKAGIRVDSDFKAETMNKKIRNAQLQKIPYMITIGDKEEENGTLAVRTRDGNVRFGIKPEDLIKEIAEKVENKDAN